MLDQERQHCYVSLIYKVVETGTGHTVDTLQLTKTWGHDWIIYICAISPAYGETMNVS